MPSGAELRATRVLDLDRSGSDAPVSIGQASSREMDAVEERLGDCFEVVECSQVVRIKRHDDGAPRYVPEVQAHDAVAASSPLAW